MNKHFLGALVTAVVLGGAALAGQVVDQGAPGNQGPWKVSVVSGGGSGGGLVGDAGVWINGSYSGLTQAPEQFSLAYQQSFPVIMGTVTDDPAGLVVPIPVWQSGGAVGNNGVSIALHDESANVTNPITDSIAQLFVQVSGCRSLSNLTSAISDSDTSVAINLATKYVTVCNGKENGPGVAIKCSINGSVALGSANAGDYLEVGDCVTYDQAFTTTINCITNGGTQDLALTVCSRF